MTDKAVRQYEVSISVSVTAHSEDEAVAIANDRVLLRVPERETRHMRERIGEPSLDALFEEEPTANLDDLFEDTLNAD